MMLDSDKAYITTARLVVRTETGDAEGAVVEEKPVPALTEAQVEAVLENFRGDIQQVPSMYSALKHQGKPLYEYAREGIEIDRPRSEEHTSELQSRPHLVCRLLL